MNMKNMIINGNKTEMQKYLRVHTIDVKLCSNSYIKKWNIDAHEMCKKSRNEANCNIRMYFQRSTSQIKNYRKISGSS